MAEIIRGLDKWLEPHNIGECVPCESAEHSDIKCVCPCHLSPEAFKKFCADMRAEERFERNREKDL